MDIVTFIIVFILFGYLTRHKPGPKLIETIKPKPFKYAVFDNDSNVYIVFEYDVDYELTNVLNNDYYKSYRWIDNKLESGGVVRTYSLDEVIKHSNLIFTNSDKELMNILNKKGYYLNWIMTRIISR